MILELPKQRIKPKRTEWHTFWCIWPRIIDNKLIWLSRAERRLMGMRELYDGASDMPYTVKDWEYRLISWQGYP